MISGQDFLEIVVNLPKIIVLENMYLS